MHHTITALLVAAVLTALAGCGQMGPLYMPEPEDTANARPAEAAETTGQKADDS